MKIMDQKQIIVLFVYSKTTITDSRTTNLTNDFFLDQLIRLLISRNSIKSIRPHQRDLLSAFHSIFDIISTIKLKLSTI